MFPARSFPRIRCLHTLRGMRTPRWTGWFLQRPEHHSIHHQRGVHHYNYGDITWWDRLFGTFKDAGHFTEHCGFRDDREQRLLSMLLFKDVNPPIRGTAGHSPTAEDLARGE